jgi:hypothetical protein
MDIQKEKELYLAELLERGALKQDEIDDLDFKTEISAFHSSYLSARFIDNINFGWSAWQAANAQAVPEGFVLIKASDRDREVCELIDERDHFENQAEQLKDKLQDLYGEDFGEHSNCNCPFQNAIDFDDSDLVLVPKDPDADTLTKMSEAVYLGDDASGVAVYLSIDECKMAYKAMIEAQEQKG